MSTRFSKNRHLSHQKKVTKNLKINLRLTSASESWKKISEFAGTSEKTQNESEYLKTVQNNPPFCDIIKKPHKSCYCCDILLLRKN